MTGMSIWIPSTEHGRLRKKLFEIIDKREAGEKLLPPKKVLFGLFYKCPKCGRRLKRQKYIEIAVAFANTTTYMIFECVCGWENEMHK